MHVRWLKEYVLGTLTLHGGDSLHHKDLSTEVSGSQFYDPTHRLALFSIPENVKGLW